MFQIIKNFSFEISPIVANRNTVKYMVEYISYWEYTRL